MYFKVQRDQQQRGVLFPERVQREVSGHPEQRDGQQHANDPELSDP